MGEGKKILISGGKKVSKRTAVLESNFFFFYVLFDNRYVGNVQIPDN